MSLLKNHRPEATREILPDDPNATKLPEPGFEELGKKLNQLFPPPPPPNKADGSPGDPLPPRTTEQALESAMEELKNIKDKFFTEAHWHEGNKLHLGFAPPTTGGVDLPQLLVYMFKAYETNGNKATEAFSNGIFALHASVSDPNDKGIDRSILPAPFGTSTKAIPTTQINPGKPKGGKYKITPIVDHNDNLCLINAIVAAFRAMPPHTLGGKAGDELEHMFYTRKWGPWNDDPTSEQIRVIANAAHGLTFAALVLYLENIALKHEANGVKVTSKDDIARAALVHSQLVKHVAICTHDGKWSRPPTDPDILAIIYLDEQHCSWLDWSSGGGSIEFSSSNLIDKEAVEKLLRAGISTVGNDILAALGLIAPPVDYSQADEAMPAKYPEQSTYPEAFVKLEKLAVMAPGKLTRDYYQPLSLSQYLEFMDNVDWKGTPRSEFVSHAMRYQHYQFNRRMSGACMLYSRRSNKQRTRFESKLRTASKRAALDRAQRYLERPGMVRIAGVRQWKLFWRALDIHHRTILPMFNKFVDALKASGPIPAMPKNGCTDVVCDIEPFAHDFGSVITENTPHECPFYALGFIGGNRGLKIRGAEVGFERSPAPEGYKYKYVNNRDLLCLVHAINAQLPPEERLCKHSIKPTSEGLSIDMLLGAGLLQNKTFAVYYEGRFCENSNDGLIVQPEDADIILAAHTSPYAHWDALVPEGRADPETLAYQINGAGCAACKKKFVRAFVGGAASTIPDQASPNAPADGSSGPLGNTLGLRPLFGEKTSYNDHTVTIGGRSDLFAEVELDEAIKYNKGTASVNNVVSALLDTTYDVNEVRVANCRDADSVNITFLAKAGLGDAPVSINFDISNDNRASGECEGYATIRKSSMAEPFKNGMDNLKSMIPRGIKSDNRNNLTIALNHWISTYSDFNQDGWTYIYQKLWSGFIMAMTTVDEAHPFGNPDAIVEDAQIFGNPARNDHGVYNPEMNNVRQCWPHPDHLPRSPVGRFTTAQNNDNGLANSRQPLPQNQPPHADTIRPMRTDSSSTLWPNADETSDVIDLLNVDSTGKFNACLLPMRHNQNIVEPRANLLNGAGAFNCFAPLANFHAKELNFSRRLEVNQNAAGNLRRDRAAQPVARYGREEAPFKIISPFARSATLNDPELVFNRHALSNPKSWLHAIVYLLANFGHFNNCAAAITYAVKKSFSFFSPAVTSIQTSYAQRMYKGAERADIIRRRLIVARMYSPAEANTVAGANNNERRWNALCRGMSLNYVGLSHLSQLQDAADQAAWVARANENNFMNGHADNFFNNQNIPAYNAAQLTAARDYDFAWVNRFAHVDLLDPVAFANFTATLTTQELEHLTTWARGALAHGNVPADIGPVRITEGNLGAQVVNEQQVAAAVGWRDVRRDISLSVTNLTSHSVHALPAGLTALMQNADGRYIHNSDVRSLNFSQTLYMANPMSVYQFMLYHASQMRAATDVVTLEQELSASVISAASGFIRTGNEELNNIIHNTSLSRTRPNYLAFLDAYMKKSAAAFANIYSLYTDIAETVARRCVTDFTKPTGYMRYGKANEDHPENESLELVSWRAFHPSVLTMLLPGVKGLGGQVKDRLTAFRQTPSNNASPIAAWVIDSTTTSFEVLGAKRVFCSAAGLVPNMRMAIEYRDENYGTTRRLANIWEDFTSRQSRTTDFIPSSSSHGCDALWFFGGYYVPEILVGRERTEGGVTKLVYLDNGYDHEPMCLGRRSLFPAMYGSKVHRNLFRRDDYTAHAAEIPFGVGLYSGVYTPAMEYYSVDAVAHQTARTDLWVRTSPLADFRSGGAADGIKIVFQDGERRAGVYPTLAQNTDYYSCVTPRGTQLMDFASLGNCSTQWNTYAAKVTSRWNRISAPLSLRSVLMWMSSDVVVRESPALDFMPQGREVVSVSGRAASGMGGLTGTEDRSMVLPELENNERYREAWANRSPDDIGVAATIRGFGAAIPHIGGLLDKYEEERINAAHAEEKRTNAKAFQQMVDRHAKEIHDIEVGLQRAKVKNEVLEERARDLAITGASAADDVARITKELEQMKKEIDALTSDKKKLNVELAAAQKALKEEQEKH
uniref:Uncharacterized protein n=1 Tax=Rhizoctonia solani phlegivirus 3 TaxID=3162547 RepID=A0AAU6NDX2_9VIRU